MGVPVNREPHDQVLAEAIRVWCDTEHANLVAEGDSDPGTFVGDWLLVVRRQGLDSEGEPVTQWFDTSDTALDLKLGLLRVATLKAEQALLEP